MSPIDILLERNHYLDIAVKVMVGIFIVQLILVSVFLLRKLFKVRISYKFYQICQKFQELIYFDHF